MSSTIDLWNKQEPENGLLKSPLFLTTKASAYSIDLRDPAIKRAGSFLLGSRRSSLPVQKLKNATTSAPQIKRRNSNDNTNIEAISPLELGPSIAMRARSLPTNSSKLILQNYIDYSTPIQFNKPCSPFLKSTLFKNLHNNNNNTNTIVAKPEPDYIHRAKFTQLPAYMASIVLLFLILLVALPASSSSNISPHNNNHHQLSSSSNSLPVAEVFFSIFQRIFSSVLGK